jgi:hypothetical protein
MAYHRFMKALLRNEPITLCARESRDADGGIAYTLGVVVRLIPDTRLQGFSSQLLSFFRAVPKLPRW